MDQVAEERRALLASRTTAMQADVERQIAEDRAALLRQQQQLQQQQQRQPQAEAGLCVICKSELTRENCFLVQVNSTLIILPYTGISYAPHPAAAAAATAHGGAQGSRPRPLWSRRGLAGGPTAGLNKEPQTPLFLCHPCPVSVYGQRDPAALKQWRDGSNTTAKVCLGGYVEVCMGGGSSTLHHFIFLTSSIPHDEGMNHRRRKTQRPSSNNSSNNSCRTLCFS